MLKLNSIIAGAEKRDMNHASHRDHASPVDSYVLYYDLEENSQCKSPRMHRGVLTGGW